MKTVKDAFARLTELRDTLKAEDREPTDGERNEIDTLRARIDSTTLAASSSQDDRVPAAAINGDRAARKGLGDEVTRTLSLEDEAERVAKQIVESFQNGMPITRAVLSLPVGFQSANAVAGAPTSIVDLGSVFGARSLDSQTVQSVRFDAIDAPVVAEGAPKPDVVTATLVSDTAVKVAGYAEATAETFFYVDSAQSVLLNVLRESIISGANDLIVTALETDGTDVAYDTSGLKTFLVASANVNAKSQANVALTSSAAWVDLTLALAGLPQSIGIPPLIVEPHVAAGSAIVAATSSVDVVRSQVMFLLDPYSKSLENKTIVVADLFQAVNVVRPDLVQIADLTSA